MGPLSNLIPHINDHHRWSRERIADWLETLDVDLTVKPKIKEELPDVIDRTSETLALKEYASYGLIAGVSSWGAVVTGIQSGTVSES